MLGRGRVAPAAIAATLLLASFALAAPPRVAPKRAAPGAYRSAVQRWHDATPGAAAPRDEAGRPLLVLVALNTGERAELRAATDDGGFDAAGAERAAELLRDPRAGLRHPIEPALLDLVYRAQRRFESAEIRVISGYRAPKAAARSNHGRGRAIDLVVPGATDEAVATWAREVGFVGVGIYPRSGFCHLDVRSTSHFWVDASGPGQRSRETPLRGSHPAKSDENARRRGARAIAPFAPPTNDVDAAFRGLGRPTPSEETLHPEEDDDR